MKGWMNDFLAYRWMLTPMLVRLTFAIFVGLTILSPIIALTAGGTERYGMELLILSWVGGLVVFRLLTEVAIVLFRINETLTEISEELK